MNKNQGESDQPGAFRSVSFEADGDAIFQYVEKIPPKEGEKGLICSKSVI